MSIMIIVSNICFLCFSEKVVFLIMFKTIRVIYFLYGEMAESKPDDYDS